MGWRVQGIEGRTMSKEVDARPHRADAVVVQSLKRDRIHTKEIEFQKPGVGM